MKIETIEINNKQIVAEVDEEENSIDIGVIINGESKVSLNVLVDDDKVLIRKWINFRDSEEDVIYLDEL